MDKKFLNKVVDQIVSETRMDFKQKDIHVPFFFTAIRYMLTSCLDHIDPPRAFSKHCEEVYGLSYDEVKYVWYEYRFIVTHKIINYG